MPIQATDVQRAFGVPLDGITDAMNRAQQVALHQQQVNDQRRYRDQARADDQDKMQAGLADKLYGFDTFTGTVQDAVLKERQRAGLSDFTAWNKANPGATYAQRVVKSHEVLGGIDSYKKAVLSAKEKIDSAVEEARKKDGSLVAETLKRDAYRSAFVDEQGALRQSIDAAGNYVSPLIEGEAGDRYVDRSLGREMVKADLGKRQVSERQVQWADSKNPKITGTMNYTGRDYNELERDAAGNAQIGYKKDIVGQVEVTDAQGRKVKAGGVAALPADVYGNLNSTRAGRVLISDKVAEMEKEAEKNKDASWTALSKEEQRRVAGLQLLPGFDPGGTGLGNFDISAYQMQQQQSNWQQSFDAQERARRESNAISRAGLALREAGGGKQRPTTAGEMFLHLTSPAVGGRPSAVQMENFKKPDVSIPAVAMLGGRPVDLFNMTDRFSDRPIKQPGSGNPLKIYYSPKEDAFLVYEFDKKSRPKAGFNPTDPELMKMKPRIYEGADKDRLYKLVLPQLKLPEEKANDLGLYGERIQPIQY